MYRLFKKSGESFLIPFLSCIQQLQLFSDIGQSVSPSVTLFCHNLRINLRVDLRIDLGVGDL